MRPSLPVLSLICLMALAADKVQPPPPSSSRPLAFPKTESRTLPNGLTVVVSEDHRLPLISFRLVLPAAGAIHHDPSKAGLATLTAAMLRNGGAGTRTAQQIAQIVDNAGGTLAASAVDDYAIVSGTFLRSSADSGFELLADTVLRPAFDSKDLERMRQQSLANLQVGSNDPRVLAGRAAMRLIFGEHPYGLPTEGTPASVRSLKRDDLVTFHQERYVPGGSCLAIAGDLTPAQAFAMAAKALGDWKGEASADKEFPAPPSPMRRVVVIDKPDAVQTQISLGHLAIPRNHPDYLPLAVANHIFGGAFTSRLTMKLRAAEGLTYTAGSQLSSERRSGMILVTTYTRTEKTVEAIRTIVDLQKDFLANPATASELADAKALLSGVFQLSLETADAVADRLLATHIFDLPADYWNTYQARIAALTLDEVRAAAVKYLHPEQTLIVAAGNASQFAKDLETFGRVETVKAAEFDALSADLRRPKETVPGSTAETRMKARALIDSAVTAIGGLDALRAAKDLSSRGTLEMKSMGAGRIEMTEVVVYPSLYKSSMKLPATEIQQAFDGKTAWMKQGAQPARELPVAMNAGMATAILAAAGIAALREAAEGRAEIQALDDTSIRWQLGETVMKMWFDPNTSLMVRLSFTSTAPNGPLEMETSMSDYRPSGGGLRLPWRESLTQNGQSLGDRTYDERKVNAGVPASAFAKPD